MARRANQTVASGSSVGFGHEYGTPAEVFFGRPEVVFKVLPTGLVLSSNKVIGFYWFVCRSLHSLRSVEMTGSASIGRDG